MGAKEALTAGCRLVARCDPMLPSSSTPHKLEALLTGTRRLNKIH